MVKTVINQKEPQNRFSSSLLLDNVIDLLMTNLLRIFSRLKIRVDLSIKVFYLLKPKSMQLIRIFSKLFKCISDKWQFCECLDIKCSMEKVTCYKIWKLFPLAKKKRDTSTKKEKKKNVNQRISDDFAR